MRALLEHARWQPEGLAEQEAALLAVLIEKVAVGPLEPACKGTRDGVKRVLIHVD